MRRLIKGRREGKVVERGRIVEVGGWCENFVVFV